MSPAWKASQYYRCALVPAVPTGHRALEQHAGLLFRSQPRNRRRGAGGHRIVATDKGWRELRRHPLQRTGPGIQRGHPLDEPQPPRVSRTLHRDDDRRVPGVVDVGHCEFVDRPADVDQTGVVRCRQVDPGPPQFRAVGPTDHGDPRTAVAGPAVALDHDLRLAVAVDIDDARIAVAAIAGNAGVADPLHGRLEGLGEGGGRLVGEGAVGVEGGKAALVGLGAFGRRQAAAHRVDVVGEHALGRSDGQRLPQLHLVVVVDGHRRRARRQRDRETLGGERPGGVGHPHRHRIAAGGRATGRPAQRRPGERHPVGPAVQAEGQVPAVRIGRAQRAAEGGTARQRRIGLRGQHRRPVGRHHGDGEALVVAVAEGVGHPDGEGVGAQLVGQPVQPRAGIQRRPGRAGEQAVGQPVGRVAVVGGELQLELRAQRDGPVGNRRQPGSTSLTVSVTVALPLSAPSSAVSLST